MPASATQGGNNNVAGPLMNNTVFVMRERFDVRIHIQFKRQTLKIRKT